MKTKLKYHKRRLLSHLIVGSIFSILGVFSYIANTNVLFFEPIVSTSLGILNFAIYGYMRYFQYATIENNAITRHTVLNKSIDLNTLERVERKDGDLIITAGSKKLALNLNCMEADSITVLNAFLLEAEIKTVQQ